MYSTLYVSFHKSDENKILNMHTDTVKTYT